MADKSIALRAADAYAKAYDAKLAELESGSGKQKHLAPEIAAAKAGQAAARKVREEGKDTMSDGEYKLKNRTKRLDRIIDGEPAPKKSALRRAKEKEAMGDKDLWTAEERAAYAKAYSEEQKKRGNKPGKPTKGLFDGNAQDKKGKEAVDDYEKDFDTEATIAELKKKKEELLKGLSGKSEAEKKKIRKQLEELNDDIMDLESR